MIVSIGNLNLDVYFMVDDVPSRGASVKAKKFYMTGGGAASNFAVAVARLGIASRIVACIGDDFLGNMLLDELKKEGVNVDFVKRVRERTGIVVILVDREGERTMITFRGANALLEPKMIDLKALQNASLLHIASVEGSKASAIIDHVKKLGYSTLVSYDPGGIAIKKPVDVVEAALKADIILLNEREFEAIEEYGFKSIGDKIVVIKRGDEGAEAIHRSRKIFVRAFKVKVVDTTGAGDSFNAGFLVSYLKGLTLREALIVGNACGALKVTRAGARGSPKFKELFSFLNERGLSETASKLDKPIALNLKR